MEIREYKEALEALHKEVDLSDNQESLESSTMRCVRCHFSLTAFLATPVPMQKVPNYARIVIELKIVRCHRSSHLKIARTVMIVTILLNAIDVWSAPIALDALD